MNLRKIRSLEEGESSSFDGWGVRRKGEAWAWPRVGVQFCYNGSRWKAHPSWGLPLPSTWLHAWNSWSLSWSTWPSRGFFPPTDLNLAVLKPGGSAPDHLLAVQRRGLNTRGCEGHSAVRPLLSPPLHSVRREETPLRRGAEVLYLPSQRDLGPRQARARGELPSSSGQLTPEGTSASIGKAAALYTDSNL